MKYAGKRFLVTGVAGFIGGHVARRLLQLGGNVLGLDNLSGGDRKRLSELDCEILKADVCDRNLNSKIKGELDFILHFGGPSSVILFNENPMQRYGETTVGFLNILELAKKKSVEKVVFPSSGSVYGRTKPPQSEESKLRPVNLYGIAKISCEILANLYSDQVKSVGLRIFAGYGPGEDHKKNIASPVTIFLTSMLNKQRPLIFGDGTQSRDFVYIDDIVKVVLNVVEMEAPPILNLGTGRSYTFNEVIGILNSFLELNIVPRYVGKPTKYLEKTQADITLLRRTMSIQPLSLEDGLSSYFSSDSQVKLGMPKWRKKHIGDSHISG